MVGSRELDGKHQALVGQVVEAFTGRGWNLAVGCATGADAAALQAVVAGGAAARCTIFTAFAAGGSGSCRYSNLSGVRMAAEAGSMVHWLAGGGLAAPLAERLRQRATALVRFVGSGEQRSGLVAFLSRPNSYGSLAAMRQAVGLV